MSFVLKTDSLKTKLLKEMKNIIIEEIINSDSSEEMSLKFESLTEHISNNKFKILKEYLNKSKITEIKIDKVLDNFEIKIFVENISRNQIKQLKEKNIISESIDIFDQTKILIIKNGDIYDK